MKQVYDEYAAPFGTIYVVMDERGVRKIFLTASHWRDYLTGQTGPIRRDQAFCQGVTRELEEYFQGARREFTTPLAPEGTEFYQRVWNTLLEIPYGETRSYSQIAEATGSPRAQRAIGQANRKNPLPILIPCHRVVGKNGAMTGYLGDHLEIKRYLLQLESGFKNESKT